MTEEQPAIKRDPFHQTNLGSGLILLALGSMTAGSGWIGSSVTDLPPWVFLAGAVVLIFIGSLVIRPLRNVWKRSGRWLKSLRFTTEPKIQKRIEDSKVGWYSRKQVELALTKLKNAKDLEKESALASERLNTRKAENEVTKLRGQIRDHQMRASQRLQGYNDAKEAAQELGSKVEALTKQGRERALRIKELEEELKAAQERIWDLELSDVEEGPHLPMPDPRWDVRFVDGFGGGHWELHNLVDRSVAQEVRLEADPDFRIASGAHWKDLSGVSMGEFEANYTSGMPSIEATVTWFDESTNYRKQTVRVWRPGPAF